MKSELVTITQPVTAVLSTADAKLHLRVSHSGDDSYIDELVKAAALTVQNITGYRLMFQTIELRLDEFPSGSTIRLEVMNVKSISSVKYDDTDDEEQTWTSSNYWTDLLSKPARLTKKPTVNWPSTIANKPGAVRIRMTAGESAASTVPAHLVQAVKLLVGSAYEMRESIIAGTIIAEVPMGVQYLLDNPEYSFHRL